MSKPKIEKDISIPDEVLRDLLTPSEIRMLKNRWQIINLLRDGRSIRAIAEEVGVGTDTVVRTSRMMEKGLAKDKSAQNKTSWVFGKGDE